MCGRIRDRRHGCELHGARRREKRVLKRCGWAVEADGLFGAPPIQVVVGDECHPTLLKSLGMLGLGRSRLTRVPVDSQGRMRADKLPRLTAPSILCVQAGNVNSGAFDPFEPLCAAARDAGAWIHVDGAFGLWARASGALSHLAHGLELADSWATDAHKWLNVPYDSGIAFVRDGQALQSAMAITAEYLPGQGERRNPADFTPELSRRARGIEVYAALLSLGREGLAAMIERNCAQARRFAQELQKAGFEVLNDVVLNQVVVRFGDPEPNPTHHRSHSARRNLLGRRHRVAGPHGHAHQRVFVGDHRRRRGAQPRGDGALRPRM